MKLFSVFCITVVMSFSASAIVIRHDKADDLYRDKNKAPEALVTFTTPHEGKDVVVGSGTYIGNGWVLTAAHVANFFEKPDVAQLGSETLKIKSVVLHQQWKDRQYGYDIALVKIQQPAKPIGSVSLFSYDVQTGDIITIAGRGDTGNGELGMKLRDGHLRVAQNRVTEINGQWLSFTFDAPDNNALALEGVGGGGDSGGPVYIVKEGVTHLLGLSSWQDTQATNWEQGFYGVVDYYTYLNHYRTWIESHIIEQR